MSIAWTFFDNGFMSRDHDLALAYTPLQAQMGAIMESHASYACKKDSLPTLTRMRYE
jgi:hypothetical protein